MFHECTRYLQGRVIVSGDRVEYWRYEHPVRADIIERKNISEISDYKDKQKKNLYRAQATIRQLIWCNLSDYTKVLTLTFRETELDLTSMKRKITTFLQFMSRHGYKLNYIWVPEHQTKRGQKEGNQGSLHAHFVIFNDEIIPIDLLKKAWTWGNFKVEIANGCKTDSEKSIKSLAAYLSKYITKETVAEYGQHCYYCSLGLKRPEVIDIECYKYIDDEGRIVFTDVERNLNYYERLFNFEYSSSYLCSYQVGNTLTQFGVLYKQGGLKK